MEVSRTIKNVLITLRTLSLIVLSILLLGMIIEYKSYRTEQPVFVFLVDDSASMLNYKDSTLINKQVNEIKNKVRNRFADRFEYKELYVGDQVSDSFIGYKSLTSDLNEGFEYIRNRYYNRNVGAVCFISDGNYNRGNNPIYTAQKLNFAPIYTLGVGDTVQKRDQLIRNVTVNDLAFLNNKFPIEVDIEGHKMGKGKTFLSLWSDEHKLEEQELTYTDGVSDFQHIQFLVEAKVVGFKSFQLKLRKEENESSYENNEKRFYVDVIDSRSKILILAQAPHPDISALAQTLKLDENIEVSTELISTFTGKFETYAMVVLHGGVNSANQSILNNLKKSKVPVFYMMTTSCSSSAVKSLGIGLQVPNGTGMDEVQTRVSPAFQLFELEETTKQELERFPPLKVRFGNYGLNGGEVLLSQRIGTVVKKDPLLGFNTINGVKTAVLTGEGLWKWKLSDFTHNGNHKAFNDLINKTVQYLTVKKNTDPLHVQLPRRFNVVDDILINATFYNSSFDPITSPDISFELKNEKGEEQNFTFAKSAQSYFLSLGKLKEGKYAWEASTAFNGRNYKKSGVFVVENVSIEQQNTYADHNLLVQIAQKTNGEFYALNQADNMLNAIESRDDIAAMSYEEAEFLDLIDWKVLFATVALLLALEWFLRRYFGTY